MTVQVLVKDLPREDRDGDDDQPPTNMKNFRFGDILCCFRCGIVSTNNQPHRCCYLFPSGNLEVSSMVSYLPMSSNNTLDCFRGRGGVDCCVHTSK